MPNRLLWSLKNFQTVIAGGKFTCDKEQTIQEMATGEGNINRQINNSFSQLQEMQCVSVENLQEIFRKLPNPELFRQGLVNLLQTGTELLIAYDNAMDPHKKHPENLYSERRTFPDTPYFAGQFIPDRDLVISPERDIGINSVNQQNDVKVNSHNNFGNHQNGSCNIVESAVKKNRTLIQSNPVLRNRSTISIETQNNESSKNRTSISPHSLNTRNSRQSIVSQHEEINTGGPYEGSNTPFENCKEMINEETQTLNSQQESENTISHDSLEEKLTKLRRCIQASGILLQNTDLFIPTVHHNVNTEDKKTTKNSNNRKSAGCTLDSDLLPDKNSNGSTEGTHGDNISDDVSEVSDDQMDMNNVKKYCHCKSYSKKRVRRVIPKIPPNTPLVKDGQTENIIRNRDGQLVKLDLALTQNFLKRSLRNARSAESIQASSASMRPRNNLTRIDNEQIDPEIVTKERTLVFVETNKQNEHESTMPPHDKKD